MLIWVYAEGHITSSWYCVFCDHFINYCNGLMQMLIQAMCDLCYSICCNVRNECKSCLNRMNVTLLCSFDSYGLVAVPPLASAAAPCMVQLCWCETKRIAFVKVYSLQFSLISPGIGVLNYMLQRTPHSYFYKTQVIRQTGSAHVPRYDSFRSQGFRPLFPSKYRLLSPSHPL